MALPPLFTPDFEGLAEALLEQPSVSVRFNATKAPLPAEGAELVPWCRSGLYLDERKSFTFDPSFHQGRYYVQDASSMIISHIVTQLAAKCGGRPLRYLDACAAPGGKTTAAIDALPKGSLVVANEYVGSRAEVLRENLIKWGHEATVVSRGDTNRFARLTNEFDIVAADVPCSGEGMFRKDPEAVAQWTPALVDACATRQREILANILPSLRPGGHLIYSTCTFNRRENQDIVRWLTTEMGCELMDIDMPEEWNVAERDGCYHFLPGRIRGEGLTVALLRKPGEFHSSASRPRRDSQSKTSSIDCANRLLDSDSWTWTVDTKRGFVNAWPKAVDATRIIDTLDVIECGVTVAQIKGRDLIPTQNLAMSRSLARGVYPEVEIDYPTAIAYLRREAVVLPPEASAVPKGYVLLTYGGEPLGFVKHLGNRANNLYPQQWRILSSHTPDTPAQIIESAPLR